MPLVLRSFKEPTEEEDQTAGADTNSEKSEGNLSVDRQIGFLQGTSRKI